jgi:hypothetical protein
MRSVMKKALRLVGACSLAVLLASCGGGDSTTTTVTGTGLNNLGLSPAVQTAFTQADNNLRVVVKDGPHGFQLSANANILYATVTVCIPGGNPTNPNECATIDNVQVDTGSVGLRVLASKVKRLNLPPVELTSSPVTRAWECFPFVIGGLWGQNAVADVVLGKQTATVVPVQLIEDDPNAAIQSTLDCNKAADGNILSSDTALGSNGILGIGSTTLDCGVGCVAGTYTNSFVQYYSCPQGATSAAACTPAAVPANLQVFNPIAALPTRYNNGVVLKMPAVTHPGAATASGELIFGLDSAANNTVPASATKVFLGVDPNTDSYLNVTTVYGGKTFLSSYLDTGTNGLFFTDSTLIRCNGATWYCPAKTINTTAQISDGDNAALNRVNTAFQIGNAEALFSTNNTAFNDATGATPASSASFAWGMPFFYGRNVYLSIWQQAGAVSGPWYAWTPVTQ